MKRRSFLSFPLLDLLVFQLHTPQDALAGKLPSKEFKVDAGQDQYGKSFTYMSARFDLKVVLASNAGGAALSQNENRLFRVLISLKIFNR
jgi:hypothetical protein